jgi:hypothetical protein
MVQPNTEASLSRRTVLKRTAGAVGAGGLSAAGVGAARRATGSRAASGADSREGYEGVTCGDDHPEGSRLTVGGYCEGDSECDVIRLTGLSPACLTEEKRLYVALPDTVPTVWMNPRNGEIPPGTYRVAQAERCEESASECDGEDLYHLSLRPVEG